MVSYNCDRCQKNFNQKSGYIAHKNRKTQCVIKVVNKLDNITQSVCKSPILSNNCKGSICSYLNVELSKYFKLSEVNNISSPFFNTGAFEFHLQELYNCNLLCNVNNNDSLFNFWDLCSKDKQVLSDKLNLYKQNLSRDSLKKLKESEDVVDRCLFYLINNQLMFNKNLLQEKFKDSISIGSKLGDSIESLKLDNFTLKNIDYCEFINNTSDDSLLFLTPTYYLSKKNLLSNDNEFNHNNLFNCINNKSKFVIIYNDCDFIRKLYKDFTIIKLDCMYGLNRSKKSSEIMIIKN